MKLHFHGAAQTVTGSMHLIEVNGSKLLLECGLFQGQRRETYEKNRSFPFDPQKIDAVVLSHAHIDHSGNLPNLVKQGFSGKIFATRATAELVDVMLRDSGHIQESQAENLNFHRAKKHEPPVEPLYTEEDAAKVKQYLRPLDYGDREEVIPGVSARLVEAGHILGSAAVDLAVEEKGKKTKIWFSGDIGRRNLPIIRDPVLPEDADLLIMECTYGDKPHRDPEEAYQEMCLVIGRTLRRGGKVVIPAFAVGRTQELVYNLSRMYDEGDLPEVPVYVDSPLAINASNVFKHHPECFDPEMREQVLRGHPALDFKLVRYVTELEESKQLNVRKEPMIIISASGMAETGRIVYHIRYAIEDRRNLILIVSWQAPYTLGRRLADRQKELHMLGESFIRKAEVETIGGLSAHAGQDFLLEYATHLKKRLKKIFLVHGEQTSAEPLMELMKTSGLNNVYYPESGAIDEGPY